MKKIFFALLIPASLFAADLVNYGKFGMWKVEPKADVAVFTDGQVTLRRQDETKLVRSYVDLSLESGKCYRLSFSQYSTKNTLAKVLVIFRGADGAWLEKDRLSFIKPVIPDQTTRASYTFEVPSGIKTARLDFRLDYPGEITFSNIDVVEIPAAEAADPTPGFNPGASTAGIRDFALSGRAFTFEAKGPEGAKAVVLFHRKEAGFIPNSRAEFILPVKPETLQLPADCDGVRVLAPQEVEVKCTTL
ncbi:MAG: hypothetical protein AB7F32_03815 [Victivallaceae bacterium]